MKKTRGQKSHATVPLKGEKMQNNYSFLNFVPIQLPTGYNDVLNLVLKNCSILMLYEDRYTCHIFYQSIVLLKWFNVMCKTFYFASLIFFNIALLS